jgi:signal peptidase II
MTDTPDAVRDRSPLSLGLVIVAIGFVVDQASKLWVLRGTDLPDGDVIRLAPFLDLTLVWNRGISYGLMQQHDDLGRWLLVAFSIVAVAVMGVWMKRTDRRLVAASLALIIGGALGNLVDRVAYGAVVDFIYFHAFGFSWYVFNFADAWIVAGVLGLLYDSLKPATR